MNYIDPITIGFDQIELKFFVYKHYKPDYERIVLIKNTNHIRNNNLLLKLPMTFNICSDYKLINVGILDEEKGLTVIRDMYQIIDVAFNEDN